MIYPVDEIFSVGGSAVLRQSDTDRVTVVAGGVSVHEALRAADLLADDGIEIRVVDAYSIKPIDKEGLRIAASATGGRVVTVEDHRAEGGLGDAVLDAFANDPHPPTVVKLAVTEMPTSGTPEELMSAAGIDAAAIADTVRDLVD